MKTFDEMYPPTYEGEWEDSFYGPGDYQPILNAIGEIALQVDDRDYQGDSRVLYRDGNRYGLLTFGWGSCSGCDGLQACSSKAEVMELAVKLEQYVKWLLAPEMIEYLEHPDRELGYSWRDEETKEFKEKALALLKEKI